MNATRNKAAAVQAAPCAQYELALVQGRQAGREKPVIERLRAVLKRHGIDCRYQVSTGSVLIRPLLGFRFGWQPMCGYFSCGQTTFERLDYLDREQLTPAERDEHQGYLAAHRAAVNDLWGAP